MTDRFVPLAQYLCAHGKELPVSALLRTAHKQARARRRTGRMTDYGCDVCSDAGYLSIPERRDGRTIEHLHPCPMGCKAGKAWRAGMRELADELDGPADR